VSRSEWRAEGTAEGSRVIPAGSARNSPVHAKEGVGRKGRRGVNPREATGEGGCEIP